MEHPFEIKESLEKAKKNDCENCKKSTASKYCQQCKKMMCDKCTEMHQSWGDFSDHVILATNQLKPEATNVLSTKRTLRCEKHPPKKLKVYCNTCAELVCTNCAIGPHNNHNYELVEDGFAEHKEELISSLQLFKEKQNHVQQALKAFDNQGKKD